MNTPLTYLSSEYPGISHTFILREVRGLRSLGLQVETASIRRPAHLDKMAREDRDESLNTLYIKSASPLHALKQALFVLCDNPLGMLAMLRETLGLCRRGPKSVFKALAYFAEACVLLGWMREKCSSHVHVHFANPAATVAMLAARSGQISFSVSFHGPDIFYNVEANLLADKIRHARFIRCISHYCRGQCQRIVDSGHWDKLRIVRCGIFPGQFPPAPALDDTPASIPQILCVGRLVPAKGQLLLVDALQQLRDEGVDFRATLVGDGPDREALIKKISTCGLQRQVVLTGALGQAQVRALYDQADIFVLASVAEGVPVVLMEAMAKEIACLSTCITGIPELIEDGVSGLLAISGDADALAEKLRLLLGDAGLRRRLGQAGRKVVLQRYDLERNIPEMAALFNEFAED